MMVPCEHELYNIYMCVNKFLFQVDGSSKHKTADTQTPPPSKWQMMTEGDSDGPHNAPHLGPSVTGMTPLILLRTQSDTEWVV